MLVSTLGTSPSSPPSLTSLPREILSSIAHHLDRADALSLTYTARCFAEHTEKSIWRELNLSLHPWYGELPLVGIGFGDLPFGENVPFDTDEYREWEYREAEKAGDRYSDRLRERIRLMMAMSSTRRWKLTESVKLVGRPDGAHWFLPVLECVAPNLQTLEIDAPPFHITDRFNTHRDHQQFDYQMITLGSRILFPALTHVELAPNSFRYIEFIILLCNSACNLNSLSADLDGVEHNDEERENFKMREYVRAYERDTSLRRLRVTGVSTGYMLVELLRRSPKLEDVVLEDVRARSRQMLLTLGDLEGLRELRCKGGSLWDFCLDAGNENFTALQSLSVDLFNWHDIFSYIPAYPLLQSLYTIDYSYEPPNPPIYNDTPSNAPMQSMVPSFAAALRAAPRLHTVQSPFCPYDPKVYTDPPSDHPFRAIDSVNNVRSIRHGAREVLHVRLLLDVEEILDSSDDDLSDTPGDFEDQAHRFVYDDDDGLHRLKCFKAAPWTWQHFSDYNGMAVPREIISRMAEVEGLGEEWEGRGVEVGEAAWKVLTDWQEAQAVAQAN